MRTLFTILALTIITSCFSQSVTIQLRDSTIQKVDLVASTDAELITKTGERIAINKIARIEYPASRASDLNDHEKLRRAGAIVYFTYQGPTRIIEPVRQITGANENEFVKRDELNTTFRRYRNAAYPGKILQILGAISLTAGIVMAKLEQDDLHKGKITKTTDTPYKLQVAGGGAMLIGFTIDMAAIANLKVGHK